MSLSVSFFTLGCRLNQAETAVLEQAFAKEGFEYIRFGHTSDIVVVNTCTVTENGDTGTRKIVNKILRENPDAKIALVGCQAQTQKERLLLLPGVQWVIGNGVKMDLPLLLKNSLAEKTVLTPEIERKSFILPAAGVDKGHTRANLKIQDGCDFFCNYCEIPYARGGSRSREYADIIKDARVLVDAGHKELVLTGINIGTYKYDEKNLLDVISGLEEIPDLLRVRISSIEATTFGSEILEYMRAGHKLCRFMHISLQSGSDKILKLMNRKYTTAEYAAFLQTAYYEIEHICLGTDVIVGFPGETDQDFDETVEFVNSQPFTYFHVFSYSDRENSKSRNFPDKVPRETIKKRNTILRRLSEEKRRIYLEKYTGATESVLFENRKNGYWTGVTDTFVRVLVKSDKNLKNQLLPVKLEAVENQSMVGVLV